MRKFVGKFAVAAGTIENPRNSKAFRVSVSLVALLQAIQQNPHMSKENWKNFNYKLAKVFLRKRSLHLS